MRFRDLVRAGTRFHWRTHLGVGLGTLVATAVLVGALLVGDSVRASLLERALERIGRVDQALIAGDRYFGDDLGERVAAHSPGRPHASSLWLGGIAIADGGARRANDVQVFGIDARFPVLAPDGTGFPVPAAGEAALSERLAAQLSLAVGDDFLVRVERPSALPRDAALATSDDLSFALRLKVASVVGAEAFGRFALSATPLPPFDLFVELEWLQRELELEGRANLLLVGEGGLEVPLPTPETPSDASTKNPPSLAPTHPGMIVPGAERLPENPWNLALGAAFQPADAGLEVVGRPERSAFEVRTSRIFLEDPVVDALSQASFPLTGVLTWFVNSIKAGERSTPYSTVAGIGPLAGAASPDVRQLIGDLDGEGIVLNQWLSDDLAAAVGDEITLKYFVVGPDNRLVEESESLRVRAIVPLSGAAADPDLMPAYPGLADSENCRDWEPGVPVDLDLIRDQDEAYWDDHRGTPKAFVTLATARRLWGSRFGSLTAVRGPVAAQDDVAQLLAARLQPADLGLFFTDVRSPALAAGSPATDFGGLFLGLSFFLLISAFLLTALLFVFGVEQRVVEVGTLLAIGFTPRHVTRLLVREALLPALMGALLGSLLGVIYTAAVLRGLATLWSSAVAGAEIELDVSLQTLLMGAGISIATALVSIRLTLRRLVVRPAAELLAGELRSPSGAARAKRRRLQLASAVISLIGALVLVAVTDPDSGPAAAGAFFGAGALGLTAALLFVGLYLTHHGAAAARPSRSVAKLGIQSAGRRPGRSLATVGLLASGVFLVVAVGAQRIGPPADPSSPSSGTGGFDLFGTSTLPVLDDLKTSEGRAAFGLEESDLEGVDVISMRVRDGDDASCLNLATPRHPRILGVPSARLAERGAFSFARVSLLDDVEPENPWLLLQADLGPDVVPAIGDQASVQWAMKKALGESIEYRDERGRVFQVRIVATLAGSILQGDLLVDTQRFQERFPNEGGWRAFLIDTRAGSLDDTARTLSRALSDVGLELVPTAERLAAFNAVQNTYISIFQVLGALGVLLGSAGLALVVLRNALERRPELATLRAVGFAKRDVHRLVTSEHAWLCLLGVVCGALPALLAILPASAAAGDGPAPLALLGIVVAVGGAGLVWVLVATSIALRGDLLAALQND